MRLLIGLLILATALPASANSPEFAGCLPGHLDDVCRHGDFVYGATRGGLLVLDVSDLAQPTQVAFLPLSNAAAVTIAGGYAYVGCTSELFWSDGDLHVVDISEPSAPRLVATSEVPQKAVAVIVADEIAYVADSWHGVLIFDVSDPKVPEFLSFVKSPGPARGLALADEVLYLADQYYGLRVIDVSVPAQPVELALWDPGPYLHGVDVVGNLAVVGMQPGIRVLDVSDPGSPQEIGSLSTYASARSVTIDGQRALLTHWSRLNVVDLAKPTAPILLGEIDLFGRPSNLVVAGDVVHVGAGFGGLRILDLSDPAAPLEIGAYQLVGQVESVEIQNQQLYVAGGFYYSGEKAATRAWTDAGLFVADLANAGTPLLSGYLGFGNAEDTAVFGDIAHVTDYTGRLGTIDVGNPATPTEIGSAYLPYRSGRLAVADERAYVLTEESGMYIFDVSTPETPVELGSVAAGSMGVEIRGTLAYVSEYYYGLQIFDVSDPAAPVALGGFDPPNWANDLDVVGDMVYLANGILGLRQIDVSDPAAPVDAGAIDTPGFAVDVVVQGHFAYVADTDGGVRVIDIADRDHLIETGHYLTTSKATTIDVAGETIVVGTESGGVFVLRLNDPVAASGSPPVALTELRVSPNPFNPHTTIEYDIKRDQQVQIAIFDLHGRLVRTLVNEDRAAGRYRVRWNGTDDTGRQLASAVYICRMKAGSYHEARRMTLIK